MNSNRAKTATGKRKTVQIQSSNQEKNNSTEVFLSNDRVAKQEKVEKPRVVEKPTVEAEKPRAGEKPRVVEKPTVEAEKPRAVEKPRVVEKPTVEAEKPRAVEKPRVVEKPTVEAEKPRAVEMKVPLPVIEKDTSATQVVRPRTSMPKPRDDEKPKSPALKDSSTSFYF